MSQIELHSLYRYFDDKAVLKNITHTFKSGNIYVLTGANGAGKTTLLSLISGYADYDEGQIIYKNTELQITHDVRQISNRQISCCFQSTYCYDYLSVSENLTLSMCDFKKEMVTERRDEVLRIFSLKDEKNKLYNSLSQGYKQRVNLARAFILNSEWIILDEPTVFLDKDSVQCLTQAILEYYKKNTSFIISSHDDYFLGKLENSKKLSLTGGVLNEVF